jgi:hypothetical protein
MTRRLMFLAIITLLVRQAAFSAKVPDIPIGSKFYIENRSQSDEAARFAVLLAGRLSKDEGKRRYRKPGFSVAERREDAAYVVRLMVIVRENTRTSVVDSNKTTHALVNAWLLDASGKELWSQEQDCVGSLLGEPTENCIRRLSDDLKSAQVDSEGKRAGLLGWKVK